MTVAASSHCFDAASNQQSVGYVVGVRVQDVLGNQQNVLGRIHRQYFEQSIDGMIVLLSMDAVIDSKCFR